jgi:nitrogen-specific signal transduction histidine kinase
MATSDETSFLKLSQSGLACGVIVIDAQQRIESASAEAERILGLSPGQIGRRALELLSPELGAVIREAMTSGVPVQNREIVLRGARETNTLTLLVNTLLSPSPRGDGPILVLIFQDVSYMRKWEVKMRRLDRLHSVGTLSASMAHEVKNAFVAVRTFVEVLLEKNPQAELVDVVRRELSRIDAIIAQFLKFSRPAAPTFSSIELHSVLDKSLSLIHHLLNERRIEVSRNWEAHPDTLVGDADQLEQAFLNLFFNAMEAIGKEGRLKVTTTLVGPGADVPGLPPKRTQSHVRVLIQDSGGGISP